MDGDDSAAVDSAWNQRYSSKDAVVPFTLEAMLHPRPSTSFASKMYNRQVHEMEKLGFDRVCATNALVRAAGSVVAATQLLAGQLAAAEADATLSHVHVWRPPLSVRIGGWLPNVQDDLGSAPYVAYFCSVTAARGNVAWRVGRRYSAFYTLYRETYVQMCLAFPAGMAHPFPTDRWSSWLGAEAERLSDQRMRLLDAWLKEFIASPVLMLDEPTRTAVYAFLQVDESFARLSVRRNSGSGSGSGSERERERERERSASFRARTSPDSAAMTTLPTTPKNTSSWGNAAAQCCFLAPPALATHDPLEESPERALWARRRAATAARRNDD
jgi:hypothetical protein